MTDRDLHRALMHMHDRAYLEVVKYLKGVGFTLPEQGSAAFEWVTAQSNAGDAQAIFCAAKFASAGIYTQRDPGLAYALCEQSSQLGLPQAMSFLAALMFSGAPGRPSDVKKAKVLLKRAAELKCVGALHQLAVIHLTTDPNGSGAAEGIRIMKKAAELGDAVAQFELGLRLVEEEDPRTEMKGLHFIRLAANGGIPSAHRMLAHFSRSGEHGMALDPHTAKFHEGEAAKIEAAY